MKLEFENLITLIDAVSKSELTGFEYEADGVKLNLVKEKEQVQVVAAPLLSENVPFPATPVASVQNITAAEAQAQAEPVLEGNIVTSPLVGTFYAAPAEDAAPYVAVGDKVKKGQTLAIVEAMKLMNEIESEYDGIVAEVLVNNAEAVEYGQPLFRIV
ncbi:MAG: acetyl-CoA carboxylase biotin carboxyl carrier protein [Dorea sp.]